MVIVLRVVLVAKLVISVLPAKLVNTRYFIFNIFDLSII